MIAVGMLGMADPTHAELGPPVILRPLALTASLVAPEARLLDGAISSKVIQSSRLYFIIVPNPRLFALQSHTIDCFVLSLSEQSPTVLY